MMLQGAEQLHGWGHGDPANWPVQDGHMEAATGTGSIPDWPSLIDRRPSMLIFAPARTLDELNAMANGADFRVIGAAPIHDMRNRLAQTVGVDMLLVDLRGVTQDGSGVDAILSSLLVWPAINDARLRLIVDATALDRVASFLDCGLDQLLCEPTLSEIGIELCLLAREDGRTARLNDIGREKADARLDQLSAEVRRLAQTIDRLTREDEGQGRSIIYRQPDASPLPTDMRSTDGEGTGEKHGTTRAEIRALLHARRMRDRFLPSDLFADPAWDMMLDLMSARLDGKRVSVSSLCIASAVPPTTALRWITQLTERGLFERCNDPNDARRVFISLSDDTAEQLTDWFSAVRRGGVRFTG